jgi:hypothetical protein
MKWGSSLAAALALASSASAQGFDRFRNDAELRVYADSIVQANLQRYRQRVYEETGWMPTANYQIIAADTANPRHTATFNPDLNTFYVIVGTFDSTFALNMYQKSGCPLKCLSDDIEDIIAHELTHSAMREASRAKNKPWWTEDRTKRRIRWPEDALWKLLIEGYAGRVAEIVTGNPRRFSRPPSNSMLETNIAQRAGEDFPYLAGLAFFRGLPTGPKTLDALMSMQLKPQDYFSLPALRERIRNAIGQ